MTTYIIVILCSIVAFLLGTLWKKRKIAHDTITAVKVIENLKATIEVYKITHEQQMTHLNQRYTDLKIDVLKCMAENVELKAEIEKLKEYP